MPQYPTPYNSTADGLDVKYTVLDPTDNSVITALTSAVSKGAGTKAYLPAAPLPEGSVIDWYEDGVYQVSEQVPDNRASALLVGSGDKQVRLVVKNTIGVAIGDAEVSVSTDAAGDIVIVGPVTTNAQGKTPVLMLNAGTYYRWASKSGETFTNPQPFTVV